MMIRKITLLALAGAAMAAFAIPATASASGMFLHEGEPITTPKAVTFTGPLGFHTEAGGLSCTVHASGTVNTNGGSINSLEITTNTCKGTGVLEQCTLVADEVTNLPYSLTPTSTSVHINGNIVIHNTYNAGCPVKSATLTFSTALATPDNTSAISTLAISGTGTADIVNIFGQSSEAVATATGDLSVTPAETIGLL